MRMAWTLRERDNLSRLEHWPKNVFELTVTSKKHASLVHLRLASSYRALPPPEALLTTSNEAASFLVQCPNCTSNINLFTSKNRNWDWRELYASPKSLITTLTKPPPKRILLKDAADTLVQRHLTGSSLSRFKLSCLMILKNKNKCASSAICLIIRSCLIFFWVFQRQPKKKAAVVCVIKCIKSEQEGRDLLPCLALIQPHSTTTLWFRHQVVWKLLTEWKEREGDMGK